MKHSVGLGKSRLSEEKRTEIVEMSGDYQNTSLRKVAAQLDVSQASVLRVFCKNKMQPIEFTFVQELTEDFELQFYR